MSASIKTLIVSVLGLIAAVWIGSELGSGEWIVPVFIAGACVIGVILHLFASGVRPEAFILGFLFFGYIIGDRGFASLSLSQSFPLLVGEVSLVVCAAFMLGRLVFTR